LAKYNMVARLRWAGDHNNGLFVPAWRFNDTNIAT